MPKLKLTATYVYYAKPEDYDGAESAQEMADMDMDSSLEVLQECIENERVTISIEPA